MFIILLLPIRRRDSTAVVLAVAKIALTGTLPSLRTLLRYCEKGRPLSRLVRVSHSE